MSTKIVRLTILVVILAMIIPSAVFGQEDGNSVEITLLHTNDFHGRLETDYRGRGGSAYLAGVINSVRGEVGADNVALLDAGDVYFAAPAISQLLMGESTIDIYNMMGNDLAALGNHEFDKGQEELAARVAQSDFPWLGANVVLEGDGPVDYAQDCMVWNVTKEGVRTRMGVSNPESYPPPPLHEKSHAAGGERYQTPDSVLAGWPKEVQALAEKIYADFNKEHGTDYKFQLKK